MTAGDAPETPMTAAPEPSTSPTGRRGRIGRRWWAAGITLAALIVIVVAPLASSDPDGLERVAEDAGFLERATNFWGGLLNGYAIPGIEDPRLSTIVSGLLGVAIVVAIVFVLGRVVARRKA